MNRAAIIVAAVLALVGLASTATAQTDPDTPTTTFNGSLDLQLIDQSFDLEPNGTIVLTYRVTGDIEAITQLVSATTTTTTAPATSVPADPATPDDPENPPPEVTARVINYRALGSPAELDGILGPDPQQARLPPFIDGVDIFDIGSSTTLISPSEAVLELSVPTDTDISIAERLEFNDDGIHPIVVQLRIDDQVIARHGTVVERRSNSDSTPPSVDLSLFGAIEDPGPSGSDAEYADAVAEFSGLVADAEAIEAPLTLAVPPSVVLESVDSGAVDGDDPMLLADDVLLAAPATPFDVSSAVAIDRVDAFTRQLVLGENLVADAIGQKPTREIWPATSELSAPAAQTLRDLGVRFLAMPGDVYQATIASDPTAPVPSVDRFIQLPLPDGGEMPTLLLDEDLGAALTPDATDAILAAMTSTEWSIETIASLRLEQIAAPTDERLDERSHLIAVPGLGAFDPRLIVELERLSTTTDAIRFSSARDLTSNTATVDTGDDPQLPDVAGPSLEPRLQRLNDVSDQLAPVASMLPDGDPRPSEWAQRLDSFVSTAFDEESVDAELEQLVAEAQAIRAGVVAPEPFTFTLTGREGSIDIRIGNELDEPVDVVVRLTSPRLDFPDGDIAVTLEPNDVTVVPVPVAARSNGTSPVMVDILTPSLDPLTDSVTLTSRSTAFTGLGLVLTAGFLLILATWWFSHWRTRRRTSSANTPAPEPVDAE